MNGLAVISIHVNIQIQHKQILTGPVIHGMHECMDKPADATAAHKRNFTLFQDNKCRCISTYYLKGKSLKTSH